MAKKDPLAWNGAVKPKPPSEGFATNLSVGVGSTAPAKPAAARPRRSAGLLEEGPQVTVKRMGEPEGPEVVRPSGRVRMKSG